MTVRPYLGVVSGPVAASAGDPDLMYVEMVEGLGETLVSNSPGAALRFTARKSGLPRDSESGSGAEAISVVGLGSKSQALFAEPGAFIFRSDSNGEDLEG